MSVILLCRRTAACVSLRLGEIGLATGVFLLETAANTSVASASTVLAQQDEPVFGFFLTEQPSPKLERTDHRRRRRHHDIYAPSMALAHDAVNVSNSDSSNVLDEARHWIGRGNVTGTHRAWCADFANWVLTRTGHRTSGSGMVNSLLGVGPRVSSPSPGDIVVMRNHVTIFAGFGGQGFYGLGGNQHRRVAMSNYSLRSVVAFVRPD
jgi:uncharacterized protein (TIGR02594 family)